MTVAERVLVDGHTLELSNLDKVLWPESHVRKGDVIRYFDRVAERLLPFLEDRPLVVTRYPDGPDGPWFYQKNAPPGTPGWVRRFAYWAESAGREVQFVVCNDRATLLWLANQAAFELHPWLSRCQSLEHPDFLIFDLDPADGATFDDARVVAWTLHGLLDRLALTGYVKTSGATGLHIYLPIEPIYRYAQVSRCIKAVAYALSRLWPERITLERAVKKRAGKIYIDWLQVAKGKTITSPYSLRPLPGAPVSCPLAWRELDEVDPTAWTLWTVPERLVRPDPWQTLWQNRQRLDPLFEFAEAQLAGGVKR